VLVSKSLKPFVSLDPAKFNFDKAKLTNLNPDAMIKWPTENAGEAFADVWKNNKDKAPVISVSGPKKDEDYLF
jgi:hypothetical protein